MTNQFIKTEVCFLVFFFFLFTNKYKQIVVTMILLYPTRYISNVGQ